MADQYHRVAIAREANRFEVNLSHKRAGGVYNPQSLALRQRDYLRGDAVCAEDADRTVRDLFDAIDEDNTALAEVFDNVAVVNDLVEDVYRRWIKVQGTFD